MSTGIGMSKLSSEIDVKNLNTSVSLTLIDTLTTSKKLKTTVRRIK
jgi:hypothetical protein